MLQPTQTSVKYVYDLPYTQRMELCRILDQNDKWEILGGRHMNFDMLTIQSLRREIWCGRSPTDELLTRWGHQNHTVLELFVHLSKMQHYQAMLTIKQFVDVEYHRLIYEGEANLSRIFRRPTAPPPSEANTSKAQTSQLNFNHSTCSNLLPSKMDGVVYDSESKILNVDRPQRNNECVTAALTSNNSTMNNNNSNVNITSQRRLASSPKATTSLVKDKSDVSIGVESVGLPMIPFKELEMATNGWDAAAMLGKGGFGTVYRGLWKNTPVAIKRTRNTDTGDSQGVQIQQILGELRNLNACRHDNILPLYGYSVGGDDPCLIYQLMPNGSLEDRLQCRQGTASLSWGQRLEIAVGTARGLQFLHTINEKPLIHGDIKSANILLDANFQPKIGDFGLAREGPQSHYTHVKVSRVHGTRPYLPDEFLRGKKFSTKVDTHSFGIVLFELTTGLRAYDDQRSHKFLLELIRNSSDAEIAGLVDRKAGPEEPHTFGSLVELGKSCVSKVPKDRPEMVQVLRELEGISSRREKMIRAQNLVLRNSLTPSNPYEMQLLHDHLSQQRNISPSVSPIPDRQIPRQVSPLPDTSMPFRQVSPTPRQVSPLPKSVNPSFEVNGNTYQPTKSSADTESVKISAMLPTVIPKIMTNSSSEHRELPSPVIAVSPPSNHTESTSSQLSEEIIDELSSPYTQSQTETEPYCEESQYSCILPLISELGIKKTEDPQNDSMTHTNEEPSISSTRSVLATSSARGKKSWIVPT